MAGFWRRGAGAIVAALSLFAALFIPPARAQEAKNDLYLSLIHI